MGDVADYILAVATFHVSIHQLFHSQKLIQGVIVLFIHDTIKRCKPIRIKYNSLMPMSYKVQNNLFHITNCNTFEGFCYQMRKRSVL